MQYNEVKLQIYEKFDRGLITEAEKDDLMDKLNSQVSIADLCESYGVIPVDDDSIYFESLRAAIGKFIRDKVDLSEIKNSWNKLANKFLHEWKEKKIQEDEKEKLNEAYSKVKQERIGYSEYKKAFNTLAKSVGIPTSDIIMEDVVFEENKIAIRYSKGKQKVMIPNGTCLMHVSPESNIKELKPSFRSKTAGKYMYPTPRVFFTLSREIKPTQAGLENVRTYKYTPKEDIKFGFIDPTYTSFATGSIFIETVNPIVVMDFNEKMKKMYIESAVDFDARNITNKLKLMVYEAEMCGNITPDQRDVLFEYVKMIK